MSKLSSPLNAAAKIAIVERILASSYFAMTSRRESAAKDDIAAVELLLAANAKGKDGIAACRSVDVNAKDEYGNTALMKAAYWGHTAIVELLLAVPGIDVNAKDQFDGTTALIKAAMGKGNIAVVELLLAAGADVNAKDDEGQTALITAAERGNIAVVRAIERFIAGQAMNMWIPRHRARQRDRVGLSELDREGTPFMDLVYYHTQGFL